MPKKTETLEAAEEALAQPDAPAAETEETDAQTEVSPVPEIPEEAPVEAVEEPKPKRPRRKKAAAEETGDLSVPETPEAPSPEEPAPAPEEPAAEAAVSSSSLSPRPAPILTLEAGADVETEESLADVAWHEIHNAYRTRRMLTGTLGGLEQTDNGKTIAVVEYKGYRVVIPLKEMVLNYQNHLTGDAYNEMIVRQHKLLSRMLGAEIDFVIKGIDSKTRSIVASRKEAMLKKRKIFYMDTDLSGEYRIYDGRIVQARVIATSEKAIRIEAFGVEASVMARDLSWEWIGDARDHYAVGDQVLVRVQSVNREDIEHISIKADLRSVSDNRQDNLRLCRIQSKYAGSVTDVHKGVVYIRLTNGVNAIAHSCYDRRRPGKKDDVSFVVTGVDQERGVALGIVTRIIRQNL